MSAWELASLGDPVYDWVWCQGFVDVTVPGRWGLRDLLDYYESISGIHIDLADMDYYRLVLALESVVVSANAAVPVTQRLNMLVRLCWTATEVLQFSLERLARGIGVTRPSVD